MTEGYQGCTFLNSSRSRETETKCVKGKEEQRESKCEEEGEKKEKKRKEQVKPRDFSRMCIFSCTVHLYAGVLTKQTV